MFPRFQKLSFFRRCDFHLLGKMVRGVQGDTVNVTYLYEHYTSLFLVHPSSFILYAGYVEAMKIM